MNKRDVLHDPLTGVFSRAMLNLRLPEELERARRYSQPFTLLLLDVDHFKTVNDAFGHPRGDAILAEFAARIEANIRGTDSVFRYGGDEFVILLPNTEKNRALNLAQRLLDNIQSAPFKSDPPLYLTISIGLASYPQDSATGEGLFEFADERHHLAKQHGRGMVIHVSAVNSNSNTVHAPSRLIERDHAQSQINQFLESLPENRRSAIQVVGPPGSGRTRLLAEIRKIARLRGYAVLAVSGRPSTRRRSLSALLEAQQQWEGLELFNHTGDAGIQTQAYLNDKGLVGVLITIDDLDNVDRATMLYIRDLFYAAQVPLFGLVYTASQTRNSHFFPANISLQESIVLKPISMAGIRIWLRHSLQWEAPQEFINWLMSETSGLPGQIQIILQYLVEQKTLRRDHDRWLYQPDLTNLRVSDYLLQEAKTPPNNLFLPSNEVIGRVKEITELKEMVVKNPIVNLTGPEGAGKTTLTLQTAHELLDQFPDGIYYVDTDGAETAQQVVVSAASTLRFPTNHPISVESMVINYLGQKEILIIFDDLTTNSIPLDFFARLQQKGKNVRFMAISQTPLKPDVIPVYPLQGLDTPFAIIEPSELFPLEKSNASRLFFQSAAHISSEFQITDENSRWIAEICRLVDGLPLGIELAAAWIQSLSCEYIANRIAVSQAKLSTDPNHSKQSYQPIHSVLESFWDLFSSIDQLTICRLTVFQGGFSREMALKICDASPFFLDALVTKSYLVKNAQGNYVMPAVLLRYFKGRLQKYPDEEQNIQARHAQVYAEESTRWSVQLSGSGQRLQMRLIRAEYRNILAAWNWSVQHKILTHLNQMMVGLAEYFRLEGSYSEAYKLFIDTVDRLKPSVSNLVYSDELALTEGRLLVQAGIFATNSGNLQVGLLSINKAIDTLRKFQDTEMLAKAYQGLAEIDQAKNNPTAQQEHLIQSLDLYRTIDHLTGIFETTNSLGILAARQNEHNLAQGYFYDAVATAKQQDDDVKIARSLNNLGLLALNQQDTLSAHRYILESLAIARHLEIPFLTASILESLGKLEIQRGKYSEAEKALLDALSIARYLFSLPLLLEILISTAILWSQIGRVFNALALIDIVIEHPACRVNQQQQGRQLLHDLKMQLDNEQVTAAQKLYTGHTIYEVVDDLLESADVLKTTSIQKDFLLA